MKAKKIVALVLSAAMTLSLAACGSKEVSDTPESTVAGSEEETEEGRYEDVDTAEVMLEKFNVKLNIISDADGVFATSMESGDLDDMVDVLAQMKEICPTNDKDKTTYGVSLFNDWDGPMIKAGQDIPSDYGWSTESFVLQKADDSEEPMDFLAENSPYIRNLKFYFTANQMGL